jgi:hypothetical protein
MRVDGQALPLVRVGGFREELGRRMRPSRGYYGLRV